MTDFPDNKKIKKVVQESKEHAQNNGFYLNPDKNMVKGIVKGLLAREKEWGQRYCPCRNIPKNLAERKKIICPCAYHFDEIEKDGHCLCRLFVKDV